MEDDARSCVVRLYEEWGSMLEARLYRLTGNHADAIELAQETYFRMLKIKDIEAIRDPRAYMFTVAAHLAAEHATKQGLAWATLDISDPALEPELAQDPDIAGQIDAAELAAREAAALAELPARVRATYCLAHKHGLSYEEIARHHGVSKDTVKQDLKRAIRHLRKRLRRP